MKWSLHGETQHGTSVVSYDSSAFGRMQTWHVKWEDSIANPPLEGYKCVHYRAAGQALFLCLSPSVKSTALRPCHGYPSPPTTFHNYIYQQKTTNINKSVQVTLAKCSWISDVRLEPCLSQADPWTWISAQVKDAT